MKLDDLKKLHQKKYRAQLGHYLVEGEHLVLELIKAAKRRGYLLKSTLYVTQEKASWANQLNTKFHTVVLSNKQMAQISDTKTPQGVFACVPFPPTIKAKAQSESMAEPKQRAVYLHEIQDPGNLGTILRSLAWFSGFRLLLSANSVDPYNPKVVRASMGAVFHIDMELEVSLDDLQNRFERFAYLDMQGAPVNSPDFTEYDCYLFGNEARGVPSEALQACNADAFTINGAGNIDSLNLASAVNICAYQLSTAQA
jgi:TrmH family RNA methyltransferase